MDEECIYDHDMMVIDWISIMEAEFQSDDNLPW